MGCRAKRKKMSERQQFIPTNENVLFKKFMAEAKPKPPLSWNHTWTSYRPRTQLPTIGRLSAFRGMLNIYCTVKRDQVKNISYSADRVYRYHFW